MQYKHSDMHKWANSTYFEEHLAVYTKACNLWQPLCNYEKKCENTLVVFPVRVYYVSVCYKCLKIDFWRVSYVVQQLIKILAIRLSIL